MSTGIKFHMNGAAERKAREPLTVLIRGTVIVPDSDDLKRRPETYGVILQSSSLLSVVHLNPDVESCFDIAQP